MPVLCFRRNRTEANPTGSISMTSSTSWSQSRTPRTEQLSNSSGQSTRSRSCWQWWVHFCIAAGLSDLGKSSPLWDCGHEINPTTQFYNVHTFAKFLLKEFVWLLSGDGAGDWITLGVSESCHQIRGTVRPQDWPGVFLTCQEDIFMKERHSHTDVSWWCHLIAHGDKNTNPPRSLLTQFWIPENSVRWANEKTKLMTSWCCHWEFSKIANNQRMLQVGH